MKKILVVAGLFLAGFVAQAQDAKLAQGKYQVNLTAGISGWGTPINLGVDYGATDKITVGAEATYRSYSGTYAIGIAAKGNYSLQKSFKLPKKWDVYAGLSLGYSKWGVSDLSGVSAFGYGAHVGSRYAFDKKWAVNAETGYGNTYGLKVGVTYKL